GYFMDLYGMLERRGGALVLVEVQHKVKVVFNNLGMQNFFRFELSSENARAFLRSQAEKVSRSPRVVPLTGPDENIEFPIVGTSIKIGGDLRSTIVLKHAEVEARHCEVYRTGDSCSVRDLGTRFGTFVGKSKINDQPLHAGDIISIGPYRLAYYPAGVAHKA
ncbi:MAG: FHA domain-containing protein, partial [Planctomycetota bacterium]